MKRIIVRLNDGSTARHSCDGWYIDDGVLVVHRLRSASFYYPLGSVKYFIEEY